MASLSTLSIGKIMETREKWFDIQRELESKSKFLTEIQASKRRAFKGPNNTWVTRASLIEVVSKDVDRLTEKLSKTVYLPMLGELMKTEEEDILKTLQLMIIELIKYFHTTEKMKEGQIYEAAFFIANQYAGLTLEDVALAFYQAKGGEFGTVFNRVDGPVVMDWLKKYQVKVRKLGSDTEAKRHINGKGSTYKDKEGYRVKDLRPINEFINKQK
jgi:hypothetical protein